MEIAVRDESKGKAGRPKGETKGAIFYVPCDFSGSGV